LIFLPRRQNARPDGGSGLSGRRQPTLFAAGMALRPWKHSDAPSLVRAYADPDIHRWHARSMSLLEAESWVAFEWDRWGQERGGGWAITRSEALLGRIALGGLALEEARAEVSYWVLPAFRGRGGLHLLRAPSRTGPLTTSASTALS